MPSDGESRAGHDRFELIAALAMVPALAIAAIHEGRHWTDALLFCGACTMSGAFLGFLFAVPKARMPSSPSKPDSGPELASAAHLTPFTQLESISDWLTKMLVGAALVNLSRMPNELRHFSVYIESHLGGSSDEPWVYAMILYFSIAGFILAYIATRFVLLRGFALEEGARTVRSLSKVFEAALSAPVMVNYNGVICLRVLQRGEKLDVGQGAIPLLPWSGPLRLEVWLQDVDPKEDGIASARVSVMGGEKRATAEFEIRLDSDSFQVEQASQLLTAPVEGKSTTIEFHATFDGRLRGPTPALPEAGEESIPENPVWIMLFQQNRLVQSLAVDFTVR